MALASAALAAERQCSTYADSPKNSPSLLAPTSPLHRDAGLPASPQSYRLNQALAAAAPRLVASVSRRLQLRARRRATLPRYSGLRSGVRFR
jgi:hypothetical protein